MSEPAQPDYIAWMTRAFDAATRPPSLFDPNVFGAFARVIAEQVPHDSLRVFTLDARLGDVPLMAHAEVDASIDGAAFIPAQLATHLQHDVTVVEDDTSAARHPYDAWFRTTGVGSYVLAPVAADPTQSRAWVQFAWANTGMASRARPDLVARVATLLRAFVPAAQFTARASRFAAMLDRLPHGVIGLDANARVVEANAAATLLFAGSTRGLVGQLFETMLAESSRDAFDRGFRTPSASATLTLTSHAESGSLPIDLIISDVQRGNLIARQLHVQHARDRLRDEAELESRAEALAFLRDLAETIAGELDAAGALDRVIALIMARTDVRGAAVVRAVPDEGRLTLVATRGLEHDVVRWLVSQPLTTFGSTTLAADAPPDLARLLGELDRCTLIPLRHADQLIGVAMFVARPSTAPITRDVLLAAARTMAIALHASVEYAEAVRLAAERRQLLDSIPSIVFRIDAASGATLYANAAVQRVLGTPVARALGLPGLEGLLADETERENMRAARRTLSRDARDAHYEWTDRRFLHHDGRALILRTRLYPVADASAVGDALVIEGIAQDVTEEIEARKQLVQADRLASLGMLAAGVAHEINNPTAFISLGVQQLGRMIGLLPDDGEAVGSTRKRMSEVVAELSDGVQRIVQIVGELKLFARIPESAYSTPVDVNRLITSAVTLARSELRRRARVEVELGDLPPLPGDHARLGQVFVNLLVNAAQAIPPGNEESNVVRVATRAFDGYVEINVSDSGVGISPANLPRIFDPFFTTKPPGEGTGLGLAISFDLIRRAGGTIDVESTEGVGTSFRVRLPVREFIPQRGSKPTIAPSQTGGRLLVVEDEHYLGVAIARALAATYLVELASDAHVALERIERSGGVEYDVVLCDLRMPGMDGRVFYDAVRSRWPAQAERFVFLTGAGFGGEFEAFVRATDRPVLEKPFEMSELEDVVARVVNRDESVRTA